jgi:hypothetical protein
MALKDFEFCDAQARESRATGLGLRVSRSITDDACWRIRVDFEEMPDLTVTTRQAARFWAIDEQVAAAALQHLEERGILRQTRLGFRRSW